MSIRLRLTLWYSGILALMLFIFCLTLYLFLHTYIYSGVKKDLSEQSDRIIQRLGYQFVMSNKGLDRALALNEYDVRSSSMLIQLSDVRMKSVSRNDLLRYYNVEIPLSAALLESMEKGRARYEEALLPESDLRLMIYHKPIRDDENQLLAVLQVATPFDPFVGFFDALRFASIMLAIIALLLAATLGWFLSRKTLQPIEHVIKAANQIESGSDLNKRIAYDGPPDEIGRLINTINGMLERIQAMYSEMEESNHAQRRFVSDASHELRTPLTTIRGNVELLERMWKQLQENELQSLQAGEGSTLPAMQHSQETIELTREAMHDIAVEAARMSRLVNDLLSLARADAGYVMQKEAVEILPLLEDVARQAQLLPRSAEWIVGDLSSLQGAHVIGQSDYLRQLLFIFIENAFKFTEQGYVRLDVEEGDGDQIGIRISDTGIGMKKEQVPHVFHRFYRADISRGKKAGTGLGLSIAKWIIDEHNGSIEVMTREDEGTTFIIWLPATFLPPLQ